MFWRQSVPESECYNSDSEKQKQRNAKNIHWENDVEDCKCLENGTTSTRSADVDCYDLYLT